MSRNEGPTFVRNQPALTSSDGRVWLIVGGILAAVCVAVLLTLSSLLPVMAVVGAAACVVLYAAMWFVRFAVPDARLRLRLGLLAILFGGIAAVGLVFVLVIGGLSS
jgi:hypothetical protein